MSRFDSKSMGPGAIVRFLTAPHLENNRDCESLRLVGFAGSNSLGESDLLGKHARIAFHTLIGALPIARYNHAID